jgi:methyltransferase (TIGR00027 family)
MKQSQPSQTASVVTLLRAFGDLGLSHVPEFHDPTARRMLAPRWFKRLARVEERMRRHGRSTMLEAARHGADMVVLRTLVIDEHVRSAVARGARQLVILGAGLDGRPYRLPELADVEVFEVDHPATQAFKRERAAELPLLAKSVEFVAVDFERDTLQGKLAQAGHRGDAPTVWLWEGVVMYLTRDATRATVRSVARLSAPDSTLILNYHTRRRSLPMNLVLRLWSEPQIGHFTPEEIAAELAGAGFRVIEDTSTGDWAVRFHVELPRFRVRDAARVVVACP